MFSQFRDGIAYPGHALPDNQVLYNSSIAEISLLKTEIILDWIIQITDFTSLSIALIANRVDDSHKSTCLHHGDKAIMAGFRAFSIRHLPFLTCSTQLPTSISRMCDITIRTIQMFE